jgi:hypothetical protein
VRGKSPILRGTPRAPSLSTKAKQLGVICMSVQRTCLALSLLLTTACAPHLSAQQPVFSLPDSSIAPFRQPSPPATITLPAGTRLPLALQNGISTRNAKPGDSVYFQTTYPIAQDNRIVIPMGTFARAEVISVKRPGHFGGRAELQMRITSLTFVNGYVIPFAALPGNLDMQAKESLDNGGKIKGPSGTPQTASTIGTATLTGLAVGTYGGIVGGVATSSARAFSTGVLAGGGAGLLTGILIVALSHGPEVQLRRGSSLEAIFDRPLTLDPALLPPSEPGTLVLPPPPAPTTESPHRNRCRTPILGLPCT